MNLHPNKYDNGNLSDRYVIQGAISIVHSIVVLSADEAKSFYQRHKQFNNRLFMLLSSN